MSKKIKIQAGYTKLRSITAGDETIAHIRQNTITKVWHASLTTKPRKWSVEELQFVAAELAGHIEAEEGVDDE